jgi:phage terminase small subunit
MNAKRRLFVEHYLGAANGNATEAARMAGYKKPRQEGTRLLSFAVIQELISKRVTEAAMPANEVLQELSDIARADWREFVKVRYDKDGKMIDATLQLKDKIRALELLGKHHRLFDRAGEESFEEKRRRLAELLGLKPEQLPAESETVH